MECLKCHLPLLDSSNTCYGLHSVCFTEWFNVPIGTEFLSLQRRSTSSGLEQSSTLSSQNTSFFHGKFKKYSAELKDSSYILKMRQEDAPELPEVEYLCNQIGKSLGLPVADFYYIEFNGDKIFVTKNFITSNAPMDLRHLYHFRADDQHNCEDIIRVIIEKTQQIKDIKIFVYTILFDALIGNHDRHGRNLAFITTGKSNHLSPIYDNVSYLSLEKGNMLKADFNPTGKINTRDTTEPSMRDYVKELKRLGYAEDVQSFYQRAKLSNLYQLIKISFCSELMKEAIKKLLTKRFKELENEIDN